MAAPQTYIHNIPSIHATNPALPPVLGQVDLTQAILAGNVIAHQDLSHAKAVAKMLKGINESGDNPLVTDVIAESAELRAKAVEAAHCMAFYAPVNLVNVLQAINLRLDQIAVDGECTAAAMQNNRIIGRNSRIQGGQPYAPLLKTNVGHGLALANCAAQNLNHAIQQALAAPAHIPNIGSIPLNFNPDLPNYQHIDILNMVIFYNDDFGILPGDSIGSRIDSFRRFLVEF